MCIHRLAMLALLAAAFSTGCDSAREVRDASTHTNVWGCDQCHGYPPPPSFTTALHPKGVTGPMCTACHPSTVLADGHTILAGGTHRNGQIEAVVITDVACDSCHGTPPDTGRHLFHVNNRGLDCNACHKGYVVSDSAEERAVDAELHTNGVTDLVLDNGTVLTPANREDKSWPDAECAACHEAAGLDG